MSDWPLRPRVESNLLNPALIGMLIAHGATGYASERGEALPWPMAFLIPPLVLHRPTRDQLPKNVRTHFAAWVGRQSTLMIGYPKRAEVMVEPTREGLRMALRSQRMQIQDGRLVATALTTAPAGELRQLLASATVVGRLFARLDQPSTAFALMGVAP